MAESKLAEERIQLNEIEVYDANLKPCRGTLTAKTVMPGQRYEITVSVSEEYLTDPTTVYPVTIDPSLEISDAIGSGAIEDAPIYEGYPYSNFGSYIFNRAGYAGSDYGIGRTVVRLTGLLYNSGYADCDASDVESVEFYISEANGDSSRTVRLHSLSSNSTWTESNVTWNSIGSSYGYAWDYANMSYGNYACFDITELAWEWKLGDINEWCGFLLKGANETSVDTVMLSSEYSSRRPYVVADYWSADPVVPPTPEPEPNPEPDPEVLLNQSSITTSENQVHQLSATVTPSGSTVTWSSNNPSVASVNSSGRVTTHQVGQATITASTADASDTCVITVRIPEGVYYIKNDTSGLCLGTTGGITDGTGVSLRNRSTADPTRLFQLWEVEYLGYGSWYTIRPLYKPDMVLGAGNLFVNIYEGTNSTPDHVKWYITGSESSGYMLKNNNSSTKVLQPEVDYGSEGTPIITDEYDEYNDDDTKYFWSLEQATGAQIYDNGILAITPPVRGIVIGSHKTLAQLGIAVNAYGESISQNFTWHCSDTGIAIDSATGAITANTVGSYTVTGTHHYGSVSFVVNVVPFESLYGFVRNENTKKFLTASATSASVGGFYGGATQKWTFTHTGDGYYTIVSQDNLYLSISSTSGQSDLSAIIKTGTVTDDMKWRVTPSSGTSYVIAPLTGIASNQALSSNLQTCDNSSSAGNSISWELTQTTGAIFIAIIEANVEEEDRTASFDSARASLQAIGYDVQSPIIDRWSNNPHLTNLEVAMLMSTNRIFYSRSHGAQDHLQLFGYGFSISTIEDCADNFLSACELVLYGACLTGEGRENGNNLVNATVNAGAQTVVGFDQVVNRVEVDNWGREFFAHIREGFSVEISCATVTEIIRVEMAESDPDFEISTDSYYIGGFKTASFGQ